MNNRLILQTIFGRKLEEDFIQKVSDRKEEIFRRDIKGKVQTLPGVIDWLRRFEKMGFKQAVASSAPQANIDALLDELGIRGFFLAEAAGATLKGKPDPAVFLLAAQLLDVDPARCLVIEDSIAGVEAAKRAGCRCLAVLTTNPAEALTLADLIVQDLSRFTIEMFNDLAHCKERGDTGPLKVTALAQGMTCYAVPPSDLLWSEILCEAATFFYLHAY
jgi:HAD superfamily hydrolase (TIGR01509 family)